ncbi:MAG: Eco57I restriction-modification methylase domain-containing protein [Sphingobium sp.]
MPIPADVADLVERIQRNDDHYRTPAYKEDHLRQEFLNPFLEALGWDMANRAGHAPAYREVIHEDALKIDGQTKAPDYAFRIGETRKFFLEAKKPAVLIERDADAAFQLRRYAWSAKLPISILTNFAELAVYDCRKKPDRNDKAAHGRVLFLRLNEYAEKWDELYGIFAKPSILRGSFDKYAESTKSKRGTATVDGAFLEEIEGWREELARNLALRNGELSQRELNFAVQAIIDRIIFLRMCEDMGMEPYGALKDQTDEAGIYAKLVQRFDLADAKYNSGLFHFHREADRDGHDELTPRLHLDDKVLKPILRNLYYPESPYVFKVMPADILGQVYEQFLGKVIRLTAGHVAKVEEKPEVKKAGGVYYTPTYIVEYIVKHTVGKLLEGKTPAEAAKLRVLDPACGSGSFLLGAFDFLMKWHRDWYVNDGVQMHKKEILTLPNGQNQLTTAEKKRILLNNIYGVDIDTQAVEVTKLSLLLKVLEGETAASLSTNLFTGERVLPDLEKNIQCGNSLIGPDIYINDANQNLDDEERLRINAFDWKKGFPKVFKADGFDAVIGNPPYVNAWELFTSFPLFRDYINSHEHFDTADRHWDLYVVFIERALNVLRQGGLFSFIIPFSYCIQKYAILSRKLILERSTVRSIADFRSVRVFGSVPVITIIPVVEKTLTASENKIRVDKPGEGSTTYHCNGIVPDHEISQPEMLGLHESMIRLDYTDSVSNLVRKVNRNSHSLESICYINYGAQMSSKVKGLFGKDHVIRDTKTNDHCKKMISGKNLYRYSADWDGKYVDWSFSDKMYGSRWPGLFENPKLMIRDITGTHRIEATLDNAGLYFDHTILCAARKCDVANAQNYNEFEINFSASFDLKYLCGLVASKLTSAYYYYVLTGEGVRVGGGFHTYPHTIRRFPVFKLDPAVSSQKTAHHRIVQLVDAMLSLNKQLAAAKTPHEQSSLRSQIDATDAQIDALVYELYGLTAEEIALVEAATSKE